ncbi:hypothetical protein [Streptomyces sp. LBL]|uniref:hypothetical protein n=1 Tax=Streptomyces sp. LBL TaxID=2940562 RepID=UPI0024766CDA|nr:hypothetical protein [Streptomyces sp. LBL]
MADEQPDELVILVHGTFAGDKERRDDGDRWWQRGSSTWQALTATLPKGTRLPPGRLFHWSGANAQSKRLSASMDLLVLLFDLERRGVRYHLVGHSHGGSVIWETLAPRGSKARAAANPKLTAWLDQNAVEVAARLANFRTRVPD